MSGAVLGDVGALDAVVTTPNHLRTGTPACSGFAGGDSPAVLIPGNGAFTQSR